MLRQSLIKNSNRLRYLLLFSAAVILGAVVWLWYPISWGYFSSYAVTYDKSGYPFIVAQVQGKNCLLTVDVGSRFPLFLDKATLDRIDKRSQGTTEWHNVRGEKQETLAYLIPKIKVGDLTLKNIVASQTEPGDRDTLGKFLGEEFNLFLDFSHDRIIACDTFAKLEAKNLVDKDWLRIPFEMDRSGVLFRVGTDFGIRTFILNTNATITYLRSSLIPANHPFPFVSSSFSLEGHQFGNMTFESIDLPEGLNAIDGMIGMDFLKEHSIYLDYAHKMAYMAPPKGYFERIPLTFTDCNTPLVDVSIEGNTYPFELDLGSCFLFSICEKVLQTIPSGKYGTARWHDFRGQKYESPAYRVREIKINNLKFGYTLVKQDREDFYINTRSKGTPVQPTGVIGLPILEKYNLFLDFPHSAIYVSKGHLLLQEAGLMSKNILTIPFTLHPDGIFLSVETDEGSYRLMLDTGSTRTAIRAPHLTATTKFHMRGHDFGKHPVVPLDVSPTFDFDGVLGMDFLCEYPLFIDYSNQVVLIDLERGHSTTYTKHEL